MRRTWLAFLAWGAIAQTAQAAETIIPISGTVPDDGLDHFFVEFEVPAGMLEVEVRHDDLSDANILDFGLEDPDGFRGWGGGNPEPAVVGIDAASRSYVPGPIVEGTWRVVIGKAKINEPPGQYDLEIVLRDEVTLVPQPERTRYAAPAPLEATERWYAGDFHVHSRESGDAAPTLDEILDLASARGLDFVEISDHNTHTGADFFADVQPRHPDVLLLPGVEFTTYDGHANGIGATQWVDHKIGQPGVTIEGAVSAYHDGGALVSINHPVLAVGDLCIGCAWEHELDPSTIDAIEIATTGLDAAGALFTANAIAWWDMQLDTGAHIAPIGGSDDHRAGAGTGPFDSPVGDPTTLVWASELSPAAIVQGIRDGRTVVKLQGPDDPMVELWPDAPLEGDTVYADTVSLVATVTAGADAQVRLVIDGVPGDPVAVDADPFEASWDVDASKLGPKRARVEVLVEGTLRVVTGHVWIEPGIGGGDTTGGGGTDSTGDGGDSDGTGGTGGTSGLASSGSADGSGDGAGADGGDGGCGCRAPGEHGAAGGLALLLLSLVAPRPARRSSRRSRTSSTSRS